MKTRAKIANTQTVYGKSADLYLDLVRRFPLRPLRSASDLDAAVAVIDEMIDRDDLSAPERDYLEVLGDLVEAYEAVAVPMRPVGDSELLQFLIEQKDVSQIETANGAAIAESTISAVLSGKRKLNRDQIGRLARFFNVEPGAFLTAPN